MPERAVALRRAREVGTLLAVLAVAWGVWLVAPWSATMLTGARWFREDLIGTALLVTGLVVIVTYARGSLGLMWMAHIALGVLWSATALAAAMVDWHATALPTAVVVAGAQWWHCYQWAVYAARVDRLERS